MDNVRLAPGEALYREGDASDHVYFIESGSIEVRRGAGPDEITLATLTKGEILGEMGVIRSAPRSATLIAATPVALIRIDGATFVKAFGGPDGIGLKLLRMICNRLSGANASAAAPRSDAASRQDIGEIRLLGASPEMRALLGPAGIIIEHLPFDVGLATGPRIVLDRAKLELPLPGPATQLEPRHFRIELGVNGGLMTRDLDSRRGCFVNGRRISAFERLAQGPSAPMMPGDNEIVAGGVYSAVRFTLRLRPKAVMAA